MPFVRFILLFCSVLLLLNGCRPEGILSAGKMEDVLYDLHRAEGILYVKGYAYSKDEVVAKYYEVVLQKHGITQAVFDSSLVWYTDHPQRFNKIYPKVLSRLEEEKEILVAQNELSAATSVVDTIQLDTLPVRSLDEWLKIMQEGLPVRWEIERPAVDTAFLYPYLESLQDSLQALLMDTLLTDSVDSLSCPQDTTRSILHLEHHQKVDFVPNGQADTKRIQVNRLSPVPVKQSLKRNRNIPSPE